MMKSRFSVYLLFCIFFALGFKAEAVAQNAKSLAPNADAQSNIMREREEAMKDADGGAPKSTLFDAKDVKLAPVPNAATSLATPDAAPSVAAPEKISLKESEVPVHVDTLKDHVTTPSSVPRLVISLAIVMSLMGAVIFALKKWSKKRGPQNGAMKIRILTQHHLGRERRNERKHR